MYNNGVDNPPAEIGLGIDIEIETEPRKSRPVIGVNPNDDGDGDSGPNTALNFPELTAATTYAIAGTACANCVVEIFVADSEAGAYGEGEIFLGDGLTGDDGQFLISIAAEAGAALTATARDVDGNTSEFSQNILVVAEDILPTPSPSSHANFGTNNDTNSVADQHGNSNASAHGNGNCCPQCNGNRRAQCNAQRHGDCERNVYARELPHDSTNCPCLPTRQRQHRLLQ